jgi:dTDP-glucose 4,6-dehydratase
MKIIITGGAGFIGSNLILHMLGKHGDLHILNIDKLTYASDLKFLDAITDRDRYTFSKIDLVDRPAVKNVVQRFNPDGVIHLAAESHVDNSIKGPEPFIFSNIVGTFNILEECRQLWTGRKRIQEARFHHVSTDEVYGQLGDEGLFTESAPYAPNSPYSATKAGSDLLVRAYHHTYGMNVVTTNCSNNFGPHQHDEKLIPTVIRTALAGKPIPVYGRGQNVRDWLWVGDHCRALDLAYHDGLSGETYNIGGRNEWKNLDLVREICSILNETVGKGPDGDYASLITFVTDRPGHDFRYAIDATKIETELGWRHEMKFREALEETVKWYAERYLG